MDMSSRGTNKNAKLGQRESGRGHVTYLRNFWTLYISGTAEAKKFNFGTPMQNANTRDNQ